MKITSFKWQNCYWLNFYRIEYVFDGGSYHKATISNRQLEGIDLPLPEAIALLLRAEIACTPVEHEGKKLDTRNST